MSEGPDGIQSRHNDPDVIRSQRNKILWQGLNTQADVPKEDSESLGATLNATRNLNYENQSRIQLVRRREHLGYYSTGALILNKMIGTGVIVTPATILAITGSKGLSIVLWAVGGIITWAGLTVYLEYGIRFPLTGGELHYIDLVWRYPPYLMTYMYSMLYVLLSGSQSNALIFGQAVVMAGTPAGSNQDERLQKFFGVAMITCICILQSFSRINYIRFSNIFAIYKIIFLSFITVLGLCAIRSQRTVSAAASDDPYGIINLQDSFVGSNGHAYPIALALLDIMRVYSGYENANFVLEEVRRTPGDETKVFRQAAKFTIVLVCFFYLTVNISLFAACSSEELLHSSDALSLFFSKVLGPSPHIRTASGILLAMSSAGNVMSTTFAAVRVKQEIARLGIIPTPWFWARSTKLGTPGPALFLHWVSSVIFIIATPLDSINGYLVFSTLYNYAKTFIGIILGLALLWAPRLRSFDVNGEPWAPQTRFGLKLVYPLTIIYIATNFFVFVVSWFPADTFRGNLRVLPGFVGPTISIACIAAGAAYWVWDRHVLRRLGYSLEPLPEYNGSGLDGQLVHLTFTRRLSGPAAWLWIKSELWLNKISRRLAIRPFNNGLNENNTE